MIRNAFPPLILAVLLSSCTAAHYSTQAPDLELISLAGEPLEAAALTGKVIVLDFWASWCAPCHLTLPRFKKLYDEHSENDEIAFLLVNTSWDDTQNEARRFLTVQRLFVPAYWDEKGRTTARFGIRSIPTTVVIGRDGRIRYRESGVSSGAQYERALRREIEHALAAPEAAATVAEG